MQSLLFVIFLLFSLTACLGEDNKLRKVYPTDPAQQGALASEDSNDQNGQQIDRQSNQAEQRDEFEFEEGDIGISSPACSFAGVRIPLGKWRETFRTVSRFCQCTMDAGGALSFTNCQDNVPNVPTIDIIFIP